MNSSDMLKTRLEFIQIDPETIRVLDDYRADLAEILPGVLEKFYAHIMKWPNLAAMFKDQGRVDYAKKAQQSHWMRLFEGKFDEDYLQSVRRIGLVHSRIGLEPSWYIGAYSFTLNYLYSDIAQRYESRLSPSSASAKTAALMRAINKCVMIDMDIAISVYLEENERVYNSKLDDLAHNFEDKVGGIIEAVATDSIELETSAKSLTQVASATSGNATSVAAATEQASSNVASVSSAAEELSASIANIEHLANESFKASSEAVAETKLSMDRMLDLNTAIHRINEITNLITAIAGQTNLLALNATIEAARAGEAGKGFSVVATEVKSLATETTKATEDIRAQVSEILGKSDATVQSIEKVGTVIGNVNSLSRDTAESVSQQKQAIDEIARNVDQASAGTSEISRNISSISDGALKTGSSAEEVLEAATRLSSGSRNLKDSVRSFLSGLKSEK